MDNNREATQLSTSSDEIDLFDIWKGLVKEKNTIFTILFVTLVLAILYAFLGSKTYQVKATILPPLSKDLEELSLLEVAGTGPIEVYQTAINNLSTSIFHELLLKDSQVRQVIEHEEIDMAILEISESIKVTLPVEKKQKMLLDDSLATEFVFQSDEPEKALLLAQKTVEVLEKATKSEVYANVIENLNSQYKKINRDIPLIESRVKQEIASEIDRLLEIDSEEISKVINEIDALRNKAERARLYRIERLQSDLAIAESLGIKKPVDPLDYQQNGKKVAGKVDINGKQPSRYWMGSAVLKAEVESLKSRKNNDAFIPELPDLNRKLFQLKVNEKVEQLRLRENLLSFSKELRELTAQKRKVELALNKAQDLEFSTFRVGNELVKPSKPVKPNKLMIVSVSVVLGLMLGVFFALIRNALTKRKLSTLQS